MIVREIGTADREAFDSVAGHPLQSFAWGEFRKKTGVGVERVGVFEGKKLTQGMQITIHRLPKTDYTVGYFPKGVKPDEVQLKATHEIGKRNKCIFVKMEPNVYETKTEIRDFLVSEGLKEGRPLFTKYSFQIDLTANEQELLGRMKSKTRYNVRLAERKGVRVVEDNSIETFEKYIKLMEETTRRQKFFAHSVDYHRQMWKEMHKANIARLLVAKKGEQMLTAWVVFVFNDVLYYPYGASSSVNRELMASNLVMWEAMKYGKRHGCKSFDLWGALGPDANIKDPWYGFHKFKEGFGGELREYVGTYDLVLNQKLYPFYQKLDGVRWKALRLVAKARSLWSFVT